MQENEITGIIIDAAIEVHRVLGGPGLLEDVYEEALAEDCSYADCRSSVRSRSESITKVEYLPSRFDWT